MTTTQEMIEHLTGEKPFFDKNIQDLLDEIIDRLKLADEMANDLRNIIKHIDTVCPSAGNKSATRFLVERALKTWEDAK